MNPTTPRFDKLSEHPPCALTLPELVEGPWNSARFDKLSGHHCYVP